MATARKKWETNCPPVINFYSPTAKTIHSEDSYSGTDHEENLSFRGGYQKDKLCRTPLAEVNYNVHFAETAKTSGGPKNGKKTAKFAGNYTPLKSHHAKKQSIGTHDYYLRQTPSRLSRMNLQQDDYDSDEYLDACEYVPELSQNDKFSGRHLRGDSNVVKSPSMTENHTLPDENIFQDRRGSYTVTDSMIFDVQSQTPYSLISENEPWERKTSTERRAVDRRNSYTVYDSKLHLENIPCTPILRKSPRQFSNNKEKEESVFEVKYAKHRLAEVKTFAQKKSRPSNSVQDMKILNGKKKKSFGVSCSKFSRRKTVIQPFHFKTDERCTKLDPKQDQSYNEMNFKSTLRRNTEIIKSKTPKLTKVSPFHITESRKKESADQDAYKPMAERVEAHFKTPTRYRSVSRFTVFKPTGQRYSPHRVIPHTPNLRARNRSRPVTALSREQQEELEAQKIKEYKFHAAPYNPNLLNHPHVPKFEKKPATIPESFELQTEKRIQTRKRAEKPEPEEKYEFHAQKIPKGILKGPVGLKEKPQATVTHAVSPMFALKEREEKWKSLSFSHMDTTTNTFQFKANPAPTPKSPQFVKPLPRTKTSFQPFSFDQKDKERLAKKEKKIQEEIEKETKRAGFRAQQVPQSVFTPRPMTRLNKSVTKPQPFSFYVDQTKSRRYSEQRNESYIPKVNSKPRFKAKPATVLKKRPFLPEKVVKPVMEFLEFNLSTETRAVERERIREARMSVHIEREQAAVRLQQEREEQERKDIRLLRSQLVHKAQPVRVYKYVDVHPSEKLATNPQSPNFATRERLKKRCKT